MCTYVWSAQKALQRRPHVPRQDSRHWSCQGTTGRRTPVPCLWDSDAWSKHSPPLRGRRRGESRIHPHSNGRGRGTRTIPTAPTASEEEAFVPRHGREAVPGAGLGGRPLCDRLFPCARLRDRDSHVVSGRLRPLLGQIYSRNPSQASKSLQNSCRGMLRHGVMPRVTRGPASAAVHFCPHHGSQAEGLLPFLSQHAVQGV